MISDRWFAIVWVILLCIAGLSSNGAARDRQIYTEDEIKAVFIYNIIKFTDWPAVQDDTEQMNINVCTIGEGVLVDTLENITAKPVRNKKVMVKQITSTQQVKSCSVLYIADSEQIQVDHILRAVKDLHTLTIGDTEGYTQKGVIINMYKRENKIRFRVNITAMEKAGLKISADLLKLGDNIRLETINY